MQVNRLLLGLAATFAVCTPSLAQSFSGKVSLKGSTEYNGEDNGATDPDSDWFINRTDTIEGRIEMDQDGLVLDPGDAQDESVRHQLKRAFLVGDGEASAAFRIKVNNDGDIGFILGLYTQDSDPFDGEPAQGAFITKATGTDQVVLKVKDSTGSNTANAMTIDADVA
jgi:hypothetical protein